MGWLSRNRRPADAAGDAALPAEPALSATGYAMPVEPPEGASAPAPTKPSAQGTPSAQETQGTRSTQGPMGRFGPLVSITRFDVAPTELEWQLPVNGELYRLMPGSDRPDYSLLVLERPLHFYPKADFDIERVEPAQRVEDRKGRPMVRVHAMLLCARFVGQQLHPGMVDLAVNLAYVIDNSLARDPQVDFAKIEFAAIGFLSEGHAPRPEVPAATGTTAGQGTGETVAAPVVPAAPEAASTAGPWAALKAATQNGGVGAEGDPPHTVGVVLDEVARQLVAGIEAQRGASVHSMTAALRIGPDHRLTGLSGNADGQAPVPTEETFAQLNDTLARLETLGDTGRVAAVRLRVVGQSVTHEVTATHD